MKLHEFFFFPQVLAGIFFSGPTPCMNFFFGSATPPPRISNGPPLILAEVVVVRCSNFGKVLTVILTIDINTEIIKNDEIELCFT